MVLLIKILLLILIIDGAAFENYIFILEPHPFNESILISADYDGKVIILSPSNFFLIPLI